MPNAPNAKVSSAKNVTTGTDGVFVISSENVSSLKECNFDDPAGSNTIMWKHF